MPRWTRRVIPLCALSALSGCVEQTMTVKSDPPGAIVYLNDQELGRTPLHQDFTWYGNYQVEIRHEGYETLKTHKWVKAPWWNWVPFDLIANIVPWQVRDHQKLTFALKPVNEAQAAPGPLMDRAMQMQGQLRSSQFTRMPSTQPATKPIRGTRPTTSPAK